MPTCNSIILAVVPGIDSPRTQFVSYTCLTKMTYVMLQNLHCESVDFWSAGIHITIKRPMAHVLCLVDESVFIPPNMVLDPYIKPKRTSKMICVTSEPLLFIEKRTGSGRPMTRKLVKIFIEAVVSRMIRRLTQLPSVFGSHDLRTGRHWKVATIHIAK